MNLATEQFKLPWESGEPVMRRITKFSFKNTYDKLYVMSLDDYLARGEVMHNAAKNSYFTKTRQSRDMNFMATNINLEDEDLEIPECFGTFLGQFIPIANYVSGVPWNEMTPQEIQLQSAIWTDQFFEHYCEFWCLMLVNTTHPLSKIREIGNKPVWVNLNRQHMAFMWESRYNDLLTKGLRATPGYETVINPTPVENINGVDISTLFPSKPVEP